MEKIITTEYITNKGKMFDVFASEVYQELLDGHTDIGKFDFNGIEIIMRKK